MLPLDSQTRDRVGDHASFRGHLHICCRRSPRCSIRGSQWWQHPPLGWSATRRPWISTRHTVSDARCSLGVLVQVGDIRRTVPQRQNTAVQRASRRRRTAGALSIPPPSAAGTGEWGRGLDNCSLENGCGRALTDPSACACAAAA